MTNRYKRKCANLQVNPECLPAPTSGFRMPTGVNMVNMAYRAQRRLKILKITRPIG